MRAASRVAVALALAFGFLASCSGTSPVAAQPGSALVGPRCPAVVAQQPLSVTEPFSGTVRPQADDEGRLESGSLLCAYGEGAAPAAEVKVTWAVGASPCATTEVEVAPGLEAAPYHAAAADLAAGAGGSCPASSARGWPLPAIAGGLVLVVGLAALGRRRRREVEGSAPVVVPDGRPVLAALTGPGGRNFAGTGAGQLAVLAAVAYLSGDGVGGDLARAGSVIALPGRRGLRTEGAGAHQPTVGDR